MTRSSLRFPWLESMVVVGIAFGAWLIHNTFQPALDTPNYPLLGVGALDILLCFGLLSYLLRTRLRAGQPLPRSWIVAGVLLLAGFLGWIAALFGDCNRILSAQQQHYEYLAQLAKLEDGLRHFGDVIPPPHGGAGAVDREAWQANHDRYARLHGQLQAALKSRSAWDKELARIDEHVQQMQRLYYLLLAETGVEQRLKWRNDFQAARERAVQQAESLRSGIAESEADLAGAYRARWHAVGAAALTGVILIVGCLLFWLLFDRELRRSWKAQARLADDEARFRSLIENHAEPIAVLDGVANILYANPAWQGAFHYEQDDLRHRNLLELIHPQDRMQVQLALQSGDLRTAVACRLSADYGIWHDVEVQCQAQADPGTMVVRIRDVRETSDVPMQPQPELLRDVHEECKVAEARVAELENECAELRDREARVREDLRRQQRLLDAHRLANADGVLLLSSHGEVLSWNPAFARLWKLSDDTLSGHTWPTVAAHMESQVAAGWEEFQRAIKQHPSSAWEMALEGGRTVEVGGQAAHDHSDGTMQFHFRDVTQVKGLETQLHDLQREAQHWHKRLADHEETEKLYDSELRDQENRVKSLERQRDELEDALRDRQDRLHKMHEVQESSREAMRRFAGGVAKDLNQVLSVVISNTDDLRENMPRDHVAQAYLEDIRQAAQRGTELAQRLVETGEAGEAGPDAALRASA